MTKEDTNLPASVTANQLTALELLDLEYVFSQNVLLTPKEFIEACEKRGLSFDSVSEEQQLETLHRAGVLVPFFRQKRDTQQLRKLAKANQIPDWVPLHHVFVNTEWLQQARNAKLLHVPRTEVYRPWRQYSRVEDGHEYKTNVFMYSPYQLLLVPQLRAILPMMRRKRIAPLEYRYTLKLPDYLRQQILNAEAKNAELVIALSVLDRIYLPGIIGVLRNGDDDWFNHKEHVDKQLTLAQLGWQPELIQGEAEVLIQKAGSIDPLDNWLDLLRQVHPERWKELRGDALLAMDYRIAAEVLLRFYEDLVKVDAALPLPEIPQFAPHPLKDRLSTTTDMLDETLMKYGLSPQPSLVLIVEGETEMFIVSNILRLFGTPWERQFIELRTSLGNNRDIGRIADYVAPITYIATSDQSLHLIRPPTRFLVILDKEDKFATVQNAEQERQKWIDTLFRTLPPEDRTPATRQDIDSLVELQTWATGAFEYEHFTDEEIRQAIYAACTRQGTRAREIPLWQVAEVRRTGSSVERLFTSNWGKKLNKLILAEELWPTLKQKIEQAKTAGILETIPILRVLMHAEQQAHTVRRRDILLRR